MQNWTNLSLTNLTVTKAYTQSSGSVLFIADNVGFSSANFNNIILSKNQSYAGGAIYAQNNTNALIFYGTSFLQNVAASSGGAVYLKDTFALLQREIKFSTNIAGSDGGAIFALDSNLSFYDTQNAGFFLNISSGSGGAIFAQGSSVNFRDAVSFIDNIALSSGGAVFLENSLLNFNSDVTLNNNSAQYAGGALFVQNSSLNFARSANFNANKSTGSGGAIYLENVNVNFMQSAVFIANESDAPGGALFGVNLTSSTLFGSTFEARLNKSGGSGGALFIDNAILEFNSNVTLTSNSAQGAGGAFDFTNTTVTFKSGVESTSNSAYGLGGAFNISYSSIAFLGSANFRFNVSTAAGGAINFEDSFVQTRSITFEQNKSFDGSGGAVNVVRSSINVLDSITFRGNSSGGSGGGLNLLDSYLGVLEAGRNLTFEHNTSTGGSGGGFNMLNSTAVFEGGLYFTSNSADANGGGFSVKFSSVYFSTRVTEITFRYNLSGSSGGALSVEQSEIFFDAQFQNLNINFEGNISSGVGGAVYAADSGFYFSSYTNVTFKDNVSGGSGTAVYLERSSMVFNANTSFADNKSTDVFSLIFLDASMMIFNGNVDFTGSASTTSQGIAFHAINGSSVAILGQSVSFNYFASTGAGYGINVGFFDETSEIYIATYTKISALGNIAKTSGGFLSYGGEDGLDQKVFDIELILTSNTAPSGGAFYVDNNKTLVFTKDLTLYYNESIAEDSKGGAITLGQNAKVDLSSIQVTAVGNVAGQGGFLYLDNTFMPFNKNLTLAQNRARTNGGAFALSVSTLLFNGSAFSLDSNEAKKSGGAVFSSYSYYRSVSDQQDSFSNNKVTAGQGGAIFSVGSVWDFESEQTVFSANSASSHGGAIYADNSFMKFEYMQAWFGENKSTNGSGAAMFIKNSTIVFNNSNRTVFYASQAKGSGGAIYADNSLFILNSEVTYFQSNTSNGQGGAIYATNGSSIVLINTNLDYNRSDREGGAAYVDRGASLNFIVGPNKAMEINGNGAGSVNLLGQHYSNILNGIHLGNGGTVNFSLEGVNSIAHIVDTVSHEGSSSFNVYGKGKMYVYLGMDVDRLNITDTVNFSLQQGAMAQANQISITSHAVLTFNSYSRLNVTSAEGLNLRDNTTLAMNMGSAIYAKVNVGPNAILTLQNNGYDVVSISELNVEGLVKLESFAGNLNDQIIVEKGITFQPGSKLSITNMDLAGTHYRRMYYVLARSVGEMQGSPAIEFNGMLMTPPTFADYASFQKSAPEQNAAGLTSIAAAAPVTAPRQSDVYTNYTILRDSDIIDGANSLILVFDGNPFYLQTDFEETGNSFNERSVGRALDKASTALGPSKLDYMINQMFYMNNDDIQLLLRDIAPYFTMNIFLSQTMDNSRNDVYNRLYRHTEYDGNIETWGRAQGALIEYGIDENSPAKFRNIVGGMIFGLEKYSANSDATFGFVGKYNTNSIVQGQNNASINLYSLGLYTGIFRGDSDLRLMISGGLNTNETHRSIEAMGKVADAAFDSYMGTADLEFGRSFDYWIENYIFRPYIGAYANTITIDKIEEKNADVFSIRYNPNTFVRSALRGGVGMYGGDEFFAWNVIVGIDYVYMGNYAELEGRFSQDSEESFSFRSVDIGRILYNFTLNLNYSATDRISLFLSLNYSAASRYEIYS
ncbi:MAG: hypothetical protein LBC07_01735, partial [Elusimicrobiota bacterium]|nr:hypothetical protein [Elusimicrobiota bacterium]